MRMLEDAPASECSDSGCQRPGSADVTWQRTLRRLAAVLLGGAVAVACSTGGDTVTVITTSTVPPLASSTTEVSSSSTGTESTQPSTIVAPPTTAPIGVTDARAVYDTLIAAGLPCGEYTAEPIDDNDLGLPIPISYGTCPTGDLRVNMNVYATATDVAQTAQALPALLTAIGVTDPLEFVVAGNVTVGFADPRSDHR
jgi:hypothetical protein